MPSYYIILYAVQNVLLATINIYEYTGKVNLKIVQKQKYGVFFCGHKQKVLTILFRGL